MTLDLDLDLDPGLVEESFTLADAIAGPVVGFARTHTTVAVERTVARLFGVDGVDALGVPLPNVLVDALGPRFSGGLALPLAQACLDAGESPQRVAERVAAGERALDAEPGDGARDLAARLAAEADARIGAQRSRRDGLIAEHGDPPTPWLYVIVATGDIREDARQAQAAARAGADVIAVIRSTAQSLLDYVPHGETTEGFGGTYATQANFRRVRTALDDVIGEVGRYLRLTNYASGLCMPEIAACGALERLDMMLNDAMYGILFRDINPQRTFCDQYVSRMLNGRAGIVINTGEDNYLTTAPGHEAGHTVVASNMINRSLALAAGIPASQIGLGHAFEIDPDRPGQLVDEWAQALLIRQLFPRCPLKYMPPTKHVTGDIFATHALGTMFNLVGVATGQHIQLLSILTEAVHTPFLSDRMLAIRDARRTFEAARPLRESLIPAPGGPLQRRAQQVLAEAVELLWRVAEVGMIEAIELGWFADTPRPRDGGRGLEGVAARSPGYHNPFLELWEPRLHEWAARVG
ncbi:MAG TPA: lysine 5,6-aminomutase subunit alpha [Gaiellales bacterium]|nr:lysine 5,6-aminomutase subunit alpha [Gaiellales bacterium]